MPCRQASSSPRWPSLTVAGNQLPVASNINLAQIPGSIDAFLEDTRRVLAVLT